MKRRKLRPRKWVRQVLSMVLVLAMVTALMPQVENNAVDVYAAEAVAPTPPQYEGNVVYANGSPIVVEADANGNVHIGVKNGYITNEVTTVDAATAAHMMIVGGYENRDLSGDVSIEVRSGSIGAIYGGINHNQINGNISISVSGGTVGDIVVSDGYVNGSTIEMLQTGGSVANMDVVPYFGTNAAITADVRGTVGSINTSGTVEGSVSGSVYMNISGEVQQDIIGLPEGCENAGGIAIYVSGRVGGKIVGNANDAIRGNATIEVNGGTVHDVYGFGGTISGPVTMRFTDATANKVSVAPYANHSIYANVGISTEVSGTSTIEQIDTTYPESAVVNSQSLSLNTTPNIGSILVGGLTSQSVHIDGSLRNSSPIRLVYPDNEVPDGTTAVEATDDSFLNKNRFEVTNAGGSKTYDLYLIGNELIVGYNATNTITASAGGNQNGTISPEGATAVAKGGSQTYTITPGNKGVIADVLVDGKSVGAVATYTFDDVRQDHTIEAQFAQTDISRIEIISQPKKLSYNEGDSLELDGLAARLYYNDGTSKVATWDLFAENGVKVSLQNGAMLKGSDDDQAILVYHNAAQDATNLLRVRAKLYTITASPDALDFGIIAQGYTDNSADVDYKRPEAREIVITNTGNENVTLQQPEALEGYAVGAFDKSELAPGQTTTIYVQPKADLAVKTYRETLTIKSEQGSSVEIPLSLVVAPDKDAPTAQITVGSSKWNTFLNTITFGKFFKDTQQVTITTDDIGSGVDMVHYYITDHAMTAAELNALSSSNWTAYDGPFTITPDNNYVIYVKVVDKSGNRTYVSSDGIVLDGTAPVVFGIENNGIYVGDNEDFEQHFTVTDSNLAYVTVNGKKIQPIVEGGNEYALKPAKGKQTICVADNSENQRFLTVIVAIDRIPVVNGLEEGKTYCEPVVFVPEQDDIVSVTVDGEELEPNSDGAYLITSADDMREIVITNQAGESSTVHIKVEANHTWVLKDTIRESTCTQTGTGTYVCASCGEEKQDIIPLSGHKYSDEWTIDVAPSGKAEGEKSHHCTVCGFRKDITAIPATGVGTLHVQIHEGEGVPHVTLMNSDESVIANVLTKDEQHLFNTGDDVVVDITVSSTEHALSQAEHDNLRAELVKQNKSEQEIDALLSSLHGYDFKGYKKVGNSEAVAIDDIYTKLIFNMDLSDIMNQDGKTNSDMNTPSASETGKSNNHSANTDATATNQKGNPNINGDNSGTVQKEYVVYMVDDEGNFTQLVAQPGEELYDLLVASGDLSTYMVMYMDKAREEGKTEHTAKTPQTGDKAPVSWLFALMIVSGSSFAWTSKKKKKVNVQ